MKVVILSLGLVHLLKVEKKVRGFKELEWIVSELELGLGKDPDLSSS